MRYFIFLGIVFAYAFKECQTLSDELKKTQPMFLGALNYCFRTLMGTSILVIMSIFLIEAGAGCAEVRVSESAVSIPSSFSLYVLSRGKGVPGEARQVLDRSRHLFKRAQEQGDVKQMIDRRIGLEGETRLCVEFYDEQVADKLFREILHLSDGVDLVNVKKEPCLP